MSATFAGASPVNVCALLFRRVGDSLLATPALRALKKGLPEIRLTVIVEPQAERVFRHNPWIDDILITDRVNAVQLAALLRKNEKPDIVVDFLSDPRSALASYLSRSHDRVGFAHPWRRHLYTRTAPLQNPDDPIYSARHKLQLAIALGVHDDGDRTEFYLSQQDSDFADVMWRERGWGDVLVAAFFVHSRRDYKRWPLNYFSEVIQHLVGQDHVMPVVLSTPGDEAAVETLAMLAGLDDSQILEIRDLGHLGAILARCAVLIGNDGGPKHLAVALGTPTVTMFRDERPEYWTPPNSAKHLAVAAPAGELISALLPSVVIRAIESILPAMVQ